VEEEEEEEEEMVFDDLEGGAHDEGIARHEEKRKRKRDLSR
jgi:hypothetical protein